MRWFAWFVAVFAMHFAWEMSQSKWFMSMAGLPFWSATLLCLRASAGDVVITALAFALASAAAGTSLWPVTRKRLPVISYFVVGLLVTVFYEVFALRSGMWAYSDAMPTIFGIGILPLLQWMVIPPLGLLLFRVIWRSKGEKG